MGSGERIGIVFRRKQHHTDIHPLAQNHVDSPQRSVNTRRITVVDHRDILGKTSEQTNLFGRKGCTGRSHHILYPRLVHRNHVGISLDHDCEIVLLDRFLGEKQAVQLAFLAVNLAFGRILVLRNRLVCTQRATSESHHAAGNVMYGEHHPLPKTVEKRTVVPLDRKSGRNQKLLLITGSQSRPAHSIAPGGTESEPELLDRRIGKSPLLPEIGHADTHPFGFMEQVIRKILRRPTVHDEHTLAVIVAGDLLGRHLLLPHFDTVTLGHGFQRLGISHILVLHQERDGIAALAAAETLVNPLRGRYDERRGLLVVERTARLIIDTLSFERHVFADNIHDIRSGVNPIYCFPVDHLCKGTNNSIITDYIKYLFASSRRYSGEHSNR